MACVGIAGTSEYSTTLTDAIFDSRADAAGEKRRAGARDDDRPKKKHPKKKDDDEEKGQGGKVAQEELDKGGVIAPRGESGGPSQAQNAKYPKKDGKLPCWWNHARPFTWDHNTP
jgi:hypothetical protein